MKSFLQKSAHPTHVVNFSLKGPLFKNAAQVESSIDVQTLLYAKNR